MATIYPAYVNDEKGLSEAVWKDRTVIIVTNAQLIPEIQKRIKKDNKSAMITKGLAKTSALGTAGGLIVACITGATGPVGVVGVGVYAVSALTLGYSGWRGWKSIGNLKKYRYLDGTDSHMLILVKRIGRNSFNDEEDKIDFSR